MRGNINALLILLTILFIVDFYGFQAIKFFATDWPPVRKRIIYSAYWLNTVVLIGLGLTTFFIGNPGTLPNWFKVGVMSPILIIFFSKIIIVLFLLVDDSRRLITWIIDKFAGEQEFDLSRSTFITSAGLLIAGSLLGSMVYGMIKGAYNYTVHRKKIVLKNLPDTFQGFKIVQISDIHIGSFVSERPLEKAIKMVNDLKPDLILFTGDLVNNVASELDPYDGVLSKLSSPYGVYSILGNHDYGDYARWDTKEEKRKNFDTLLEKQRSFGWKLLMDEHVKIEKDGEYFNLIGIQNWGAKANFPKYGDLQKAVTGMDKEKPAILMSHDPSHWEAQVTKDYKFIDLTLAGHTHGMQFGIEIPGWIKWSPVKYIYKQWADLYVDKGQQIYVNRGLGFLGYPGRVGISPEITLLELQKS